MESPVEWIGVVTKTRLQRGSRAVMRRLARGGAMTVTDYGAPVAVLIDIRSWDELMDALERVGEGEGRKVSA